MSNPLPKYDVTFNYDMLVEYYNNKRPVKCKIRFNSNGVIIDYEVFYNKRPITPNINDDSIILVKARALFNNKKYKLVKDKDKPKEENKKYNDSNRSPNAGVIFEGTAYKNHNSAKKITTKYIDKRMLISKEKRDKIYNLIKENDGKLSITNICGILKIGMNNVAKLVDTLHKNGLITKIRDINHVGKGRRYFLKLVENQPIP